MSQSQSHQTALRQAPKKMLISTMIQASDSELQQLINQEVQDNVALELVDPADADYSERHTDADTDDYGAADDYSASGNDTAEDGALSDDERGDKVTIENADDEPVNTSSNAGNSDDDGFNPITTAQNQLSFRDDLKQQIDMLQITTDERYLAHYIIDCLDDDGYLRRPLAELVDDLEFNQRYTTTEEDLEAVLVEIVQEELEPSGVGARDLRECMLLQLLSHKATAAAQLAYRIVNEAFDVLLAKNYDVLVRKFDIANHQDLVDALHVIRHLSPKPGNLQPEADNSDEARTKAVHPDFIIRNEENGYFEVTINDSLVSRVRISPDQQAFYDELQQKVDKKSGNASEQRANRDGLKFMRSNIQSGLDFIDALQQRHATMLAVMQAIIQLQRAYFLTGQIETLHPMTLQDVADNCQYDMTTVSRVTSSKYADTEFGIIALKDLFSNAVGDVAQSTVIDVLRQVIEDEDKQHPLTDEALAAEMKRRGYDIARRTVVKYRELLKIPVARLRREA